MHSGGAHNEKKGGKKIETPHVTIFYFYLIMQNVTLFVIINGPISNF